MPIRSFEISQELDTFITGQVESGAFKDATEVVLAALQMFQRDEQEYEARMDALGQALDEGDASGVAEGDVFAEVRKQLGLPARIAAA